MEGRAAGLVQRAPNLAPPPDNPRFPMFDALRAIAALAVFAGHTVTEVFSYQAHRHLFLFASVLAHEGVAIFFAISGFLLYRPFLSARAHRRKLGLGGYAARRIARIVPAYWVALTLFVAFGWVSGVTSRNWFVFYGFGQVYSAHTLSQGLVVAWTLCVEVSFYVVLPVLALLPFTRRRASSGLKVAAGLLVLLSAASLAMRGHFSGLSDVAIQSTLPLSFFWFAAGMALALASVAAEREGRWRRLVQADARLVWLIALALFGTLSELTLEGPGVSAGNWAVLQHVLYALVALFVVVPGVFDRGARATAPQHLLRSSPLRWIGLVSYGVYLYHSIVIARVVHAFGGNDLARYCGVTVTSLILTGACAGASYYLVERPILRYVRRRSARSRPESPRRRRTSSRSRTAALASKDQMPSDEGTVRRRTMRRRARRSV